jgi:hypothetical protein
MYCLHDVKPPLDKAAGVDENLSKLCAKQFLATTCRMVNHGVVDNRSIGRIPMYSHVTITSLNLKPLLEQSAILRDHI